MKKGYEELI